MKIIKISITKSRTFGSSISTAVSFNKVIISMDAELSGSDNLQEAYTELSNSVDTGLDSEMKKIINRQSNNSIL